MGGQMFRLNDYDRYDDAQLAVLRAGTMGLLAALAVIADGTQLGKKLARAAARCVMHHRKRFRKVKK